MVRARGLEPPRVASREPKSRASASSATPARAYRILPKAEDMPPPRERHQEATPKPRTGERLHRGLWPLPLGPGRTCVSPSWMTRSISLRISRPPTRTLSASISSNAVSPDTGAPSEGSGEPRPATARWSPVPRASSSSIAPGVDPAPRETQLPGQGVERGRAWVRSPHLFNPASLAAVPPRPGHSAAATCGRIPMPSAAAAEWGVC